MRSGYSPAVLSVVLLAALLAGCSDSDDVVSPVTGDPPCTDPGQPANRFADCGNGTVTDTTTALIWLRDAACLDALNFDNATDWAHELEDGDCGLTDQSSPGEWRLPTKEEWEALVKLDCADGSPNIPDAEGTGCWSEGDPFRGVRPSAYWSSTSGGGASFAWIVYLHDGYFIPDIKTDLHYVWAVRGP